MRRVIASLVLAASFAFSLAAQQPAAPAHLSTPTEPANLGKLKTQLLHYHDCTEPTCYTPELNRQAEKAIAFLDHRAAQAKPGEKLALVLDIDETSLSNWDEEKQDDFGYIGKDWNAWVQLGKASVIDGTLRLYNEALKQHVDVFFITGRTEDQRKATADNLTAAGYHDWKGLALRGQHPPSQTTTDYKSAERQKITAAGYKIILNVGDQISDLNGTPQAELSVKLPNPFYFIP